MELMITVEPIPLQADTEGTFRVGGTRVTLETIVTAFKEGATAEEIAYQYPSVKLADIYAVISYYLRQQPEVDTYLEQVALEANELRKQMEARFDPTGVRDRLLARQREK